MGAFWEGAGTGIVGAGMGLINGVIQNNQNKKAQERAWKMNEKSADNAQRRALEMWEATNYEAQRKQMEKAGLNPGLMMSSGGGSQPSTVASQGSAPGVQSGNYDMVSGMAQMGLMTAQIDKMKAEAELLRTEAKLKAGPQTENLNASTQSLLQGIKNQKAIQVLTEIQSRNAELEGKFQGDTLEARTNYAKGLVKYQEGQIQNLQYQNDVDGPTVQNKIEISKQQVATAWLTNELIKSNVGVNSQQIKESNAKITKMIADVEIATKGLGLTESQQAIEKFKTELSASYPGLLNVAGGLVDRIARGLSEIFGQDHDKLTKKQN